MSERTALIKLHDWDELVFGGFYCMHCTPEDEYSLDDPIWWPCPPLREAGVTDEEARALIVAHREKVEAEYRAKKEAEQAELQRRVDEFNAAHPIGTPVIAYPGCRPKDCPNDERLLTRTRSVAQVLGGHTDVVWVDGHSACIALTHVDVVTEDEWQAATLADHLSATKARLMDQRLTRMGRRGDLGPVVKALHDLAGVLERRRMTVSHPCAAVTDYQMLMSACYGPLYPWNPRTRSYDFQPRRNRPEGALEAARSLTERVVTALGAESGSTVEDVQAAVRRMTLKAVAA